MFGGEIQTYLSGGLEKSCLGGSSFLLSSSSVFAFFGLFCR